MARQGGGLQSSGRTTDELLFAAVAAEDSTKSTGDSVETQQVQRPHAEWPKAEVEDGFGPRAHPKPRATRLEQAVVQTKVPAGFAGETLAAVATIGLKRGTQHACAHRLRGDKTRRKTHKSPAYAG